MRYFEANDKKTHGVLVWRSVMENVESVIEFAGAGKIFGVKPPFGDSDWIGKKIDSWEDLKQSVLSPWSEGIDTVSGIKSKIGAFELPSPKVIKRSPQWLEDGGELNLDRYLDGASPYRSTVRREGLGSQFISLVVDVGGNASISAQKLFWRGAVASLIADILDAAGYSVEVWCVDQTNSSHRGLDVLTNFILVKQADAPINFPLLVNTVSPWYYRTISFASMSFADRPIYSIGSAMIPSEEDAAKIDPCGLVELIRGCVDLNSSVCLVRKILEKFSQPLRE